MKVHSFEVVGLFGRDKVYRVNLSPDINIMTGRNGAGKTSILKLMWYIMSGNIIYALNEVVFSKATLVTDLYECTIIKLTNSTCKVEFGETGGEKKTYEDEEDFDGEMLQNAEDVPNTKMSEVGS